MKKRKKYAKVLLTFVLVVALFTVQGLQIAANAKVDLSNPSVIVSNYDQFVEAVQNAQDGDVIGIASCIEVRADLSIGSEDKHIYFVRTDEFGCLRVYSSDANFTMKNVTLDGNARPGQGGMIQVARGHLILDNVTFQRCDGNYGAIFVDGSSAEINNCTFSTNYAQQGSHIYVQNGNIQVTNSDFNNGIAYGEGGAIYIASNSTVSISSSIICNNKANYYGGGIYNNGTLTIDSTVIYDNTVAPHFF